MTATFRIPKRSKYGVDLSAAGKLARTYEGRVYDSAAEARYAASLDMRKRVSDIAAWWPQVRLPLVVAGATVAHIVADFKILHVDETVEWIEIKGVQTAIWKLKVKMLKALYPKIKYTVIPARNVA